MFKDMAEKTNNSKPLRSLSYITQVENIFDTSMDHIRLLIFFHLYLSISHQSYYKYGHPFPPFQPLPTLE